MNKTQQINNKARQAINKLELPSYQARYDRLEAVARLHGRNKIWVVNNWAERLENFATDLEMLKI